MREKCACVSLLKLETLVAGERSDCEGVLYGRTPHRVEISEDFSARKGRFRNIGSPMAGLGETEVEFLKEGSIWGSADSKRALALSTFYAGDGGAVK